MPDVNPKLEPRDDCEQLLMMLRKALQDEHEAVSTYANISNHVDSMIETERASLALSDYDRRKRITNLIDHINKEEIMHEQELNDLIKFVELNCGTFPINKQEIGEALSEAEEDFEKEIFGKR